MYKRLCKAVALLAIVAVAGIVPAAGDSSGFSASASKYVVGVNVELSGPAAVLGSGMLGGIKAAVNAVNKQGGVNGRQIQLVSMDDQNDTSIAAGQIKTMVQANHAIAILGVIATYPVVLPEANQLKVPVLAQGFLPSNLNASQFPYVFPGNITPASEMGVQAAYIQSLAKGAKPKVAITYISSVAGQAVNARARAEALRRGWSIVADQGIDVTAANVSPQVAAIAQSKPDFIMAMSASTTETSLIQGLRQAGVKAPIFNYDAGSSASTLQAFNDPNFFGVSAYHYPSQTQYAGVKQFLAATKAAGVDPNGQFVENGYAQAQLLIHGLYLCGGHCTTTKLKSSFEKIRKFTANDFFAGPVNLYPTAHKGFLTAEIVHYVNGKIVQVGKESVKS